MDDHRILFMAARELTPYASDGCVDYADRLENEFLDDATSAMPILENLGVDGDEACTFILHYLDQVLAMIDDRAELSNLRPNDYLKSLPYNDSGLSREEIFWALEGRSEATLLVLAPTLMVVVLLMMAINDLEP